VNAWHDYWQNHGWSWYNSAKENGNSSPLDLVAQSDWQFPRCEAHPGSFACWLFRPGEALSAHYWRDDKWIEYLALRALAGGEPFAQKPG